MFTAPQSGRMSWNMATLLWAVAFLALGMAAILSPPNASGILGLTLVGHVLTAVALGIDVKQSRRRGPDDAAFLTIVLVVGGIILSILATKYRLFAPETSPSTRPASPATTF